VTTTTQQNDPFYRTQKKTLTWKDTDGKYMCGTHILSHISKENKRGLQRSLLFTKTLDSLALQA